MEYVRIDLDQIGGEDDIKIQKQITLLNILKYIKINQVYYININNNKDEYEEQDRTDKEMDYNKQRLPIPDGDNNDYNSTRAYSRT